MTDDCATDIWGEPVCAAEGYPQPIGGQCWRDAMCEGASVGCDLANLSCSCIWNRAMAGEACTSYTAESAWMFTGLGVSVLSHSVVAVTAARYLALGLLAQRRRGMR